MVLAGCTQTKSLVNSKDLSVAAESERVVLMSPDIEISAMTAGGTQEPNAAWTHSAKKNVVKALHRYFAQGNNKLDRYQRPDVPDEQRRHDQLLKLHEAVGATILVHQYVSGFELPSKDGRFDWTLGKGAHVLRNGHDADYALFIFFRDSHATAGRVAATVVAAALGVGLEEPRQVGFASLVDLHSGNLVWFNRLVSSTGDLRTPGPASRAVEALLSNLPL